MRNNGKKLVRLLAAALLALTMTMPLTACQVEIPGVGTININDGNVRAVSVRPEYRAEAGGGRQRKPVLRGAP